LAVAIGLVMQGLAHLRSSPPPRAPHLAQTVPLSLPGWAGREVPIGTNEFMTGEIGKVLKFDEAVNREYRREGEIFSVYVAYWGAGKMPTQLVASHTPDRCWTENGWRCVEMKFRQPVSFESAAWQPVEWRLFQPPSGDAPLHVMYWHLVDGKAYNYGQRFNNVPDPLLWAKDAVQQALLGNREQYFIRITSNAPFENLWIDPGFSQLLRGLGRLGLAVNPGKDRLRQ
jgi:hypothetical protein